MKEIKLLSTKRFQPSLIKETRDNGIDLTVTEFISTEPIISDEKEQEVKEWVSKQLVSVFTSSNAVKAVRHYNSMGIHNVCCINGLTKQTVMECFPQAKILAEASYGADLAQEIIKTNIEEIVFFCGDKRRDELPGILNKSGVTVNEVVVYKTTETPTLINEQFDGILFFSPSGVNSFFSVNRINKSTVCFAIGDTTANSIADFTTNKIITCEEPTQANMIDTAQQYFRNITRNNVHIKE